MASVHRRQAARGNRGQWRRTQGALLDRSHGSGIPQRQAWQIAVHGHGPGAGLRGGNHPIRRAHRHGASGNREQSRRAHLPGRTRRAHARTRRPGLPVPGRPGHARAAGYFRARRRLGAVRHAGGGVRTRRARPDLGRRGGKREFRRGHRRALAQGARAGPQSRRGAQAEPVRRRRHQGNAHRSVRKSWCRARR